MPPNLTIPVPYKLHMVAHTCNPTGGKEFRVIFSYMLSLRTALASNPKFDFILKKIKNK